MSGSDSGDALFQQAEGLLKGKKSFFGLGGAKYEEAADKFVEAGVAYRRESNMQRAGQAYRRAAEVQRKYVESGAIDAANNEYEAFKAFRKASPLDAVAALNSAIDFYRGQNPRRAATHLENLGKFYEEDLEDPKKAFEAYDEAARRFEDDNSDQLANKNKRKAAELMALFGDYYPAAEKFEDVAKSFTKSPAMKWSVKEVLFQAGICRLATGDMVGVRKSLDQEYPTIDNSFPQQRENMLLNDLCQAVENGDPEMFADKLYQWDQLSKLDQWKTAILLKIKGQIESAGEDFS